MLAALWVPRGNGCLCPCSFFFNNLARATPLPLNCNFFRH